MAGEIIGVDVPIGAEWHGKKVGRRVVVCGASGSGKTTFSCALGEALGLPVVEIDALRQAPTWESTPWDELPERIRIALDSHPEAWVCDGDHGRFGDIAFDQCDTVIWLHLPLRVSFWRLLKRTVQRVWRKEQRWGFNRESLGRSFFSRKSILLAAIWQHKEQVRRLRQRTSEVQHRAYIHELSSAREVQRLITQVKAEFRELKPTASLEERLGTESC